MKRSGPPARRKPLKRSPMKPGASRLESGGRLNQRSRKTIAAAPTRAAVVAEVLRRDRECRGRGLTPVECQVWSTDCHELKRGAWRRECWLDPDRCIGLCRACHDWVTGNPMAARPLGLALRSGDPFPES